MPANGLRDLRDPLKPCRTTRYALAVQKIFVDALQWAEIFILKLFHLALKFFLGRFAKLGSSLIAPQEKSLHQFFYELKVLGQSYNIRLSHRSVIDNDSLFAQFPLVLVGHLIIFAWQDNYLHRSEFFFSGMFYS